MKKLLLTLSITLGLGVTTIYGYELKVNMQSLNTKLQAVLQGFMHSDMKGVKEAIEAFSKESKALLGNKEKFKQMLPEGKKYKANEAVMSAQIIEHNVQIIRDAIDNKLNKSGIVRREESQRAYSYIEQSCFRCHNIVRDVK